MADLAFLAFSYDTIEDRNATDLNANSPVCSSLRRAAPKEERRSKGKETVFSDVGCIHSLLWFSLRYGSRNWIGESAVMSGACLQDVILVSREAV
jgi:hypothetical protein